VYPVSAMHGRGLDELFDAVAACLPEPAPAAQAADAAAGEERGGQEGEGEGAKGEGAEEEPDAGPLRVALVGKPNAGKSSIMNRLVGSERSLVHDQPGTTTDPVDSPFSYGGRDYVLVDTAGIRRRARIEADTEKLSVSLALGQIERA